MNTHHTTNNFSRLWHRKHGKKALSMSFAALLAGILPLGAEAHRGAADEIDACKVRLGFERVHFTAYTPTLSGDREFCTVIPKVGPTNLVFDYEGKSLRNVSVEFEITKEPEGSRIFYQEPQKIKTGTVNNLIDFGKYGAGKYLAHIAIVDKDKRLDTHIPFSVGLEDVEQKSFMPQLLSIAGISLVAYLLIRTAMKDKPRETPQA